VNKDYVIRPTRHEQSVAMGHSPVFSPLTDGLIAYWRMEEITWDGTSGEVRDSSGNGNHGTTTNGETIAAGKLGRAGDFNT